MSQNPGGTVYGTITVGALLAAERAQHETYLESVAAVAVAMLLYWLAHAYASLTAGRLETGERLTVDALWRELRHELTILAGAAVPLVVLLVGWIAGAELAHAVTAGIWTAAAMVLAIEVLAGIKAELTGRELIAQAAVGVALGCLVIVVHLLLH